MKFDVRVTHEAGWTRVAVEGQSPLGRLLSLLQVLQLDCASWPHAAALIDLGALETQLTADEQAAFLQALADALPRMRKIAVVSPAMHDAAGVRVFASEDAARAWLR